MGQKVRLNPICQKTEGPGEGGAGGGKLELPLGRGRGARDPPKAPLHPLPKHMSPCFSSLPAARHSGTSGMLHLLWPAQAPSGSAAVRMCPSSGLPRPRVPVTLRAVVYWVAGTNDVTASLVPLGAASRMPDAFRHKAFTALRDGEAAAGKPEHRESPRV